MWLSTECIKQGMRAYCRVAPSLVCRLLVSGSAGKGLQFSWSDRHPGSYIFFFKNSIFVFERQSLGERERGMERGRKGDLLANSFPKWQQQPVLGQAEAVSQELNPSLTHGWQGYLDHLQPSSKYLNRRLDWKQGRQDSNSCSNIGC